MESFGYQANMWDVGTPDGGVSTDPLAQRSPDAAPGSAARRSGERRHAGGSCRLGKDFGSKEAVVLYPFADYHPPVSVTVDIRVVGPGEDDYAEAAWTLKEEIRRTEGVLKQRKGFFSDAYRRSTVYVLIEEPGEELVGFAAARRDGYVLFLAVAEDHRGRGYGRQLVQAVADDHRSVTCHARTTNDDAVEFYQHVGFEVVRRSPNYYEDGGAAYYLKIGSDSITDRLSNLF